MLQCAAFAGLAGSAFLFLPALCPFCLNFHQREALCFSVGKDGCFASEGFSRQLPVATAAHTASTGWSVASLVLLPTRLSKPHTGVHRAEFLFCAQNEVTPPPLGGGAGYRLSFGLLGLPCSSTTGSHGSNGAGLVLCWCRSPTQLPKPHTGPHRTEFGFHRLFLPAFLGGSAANCRSRW